MLVQRGGIDLGTPSLGGAADQAKESILERGRDPSAGPTRQSRSDSPSPRRGIRSGIFGTSCHGSPGPLSPTNSQNSWRSADPLGPTEGAPRAVAVIEPLDLEFTGAVLA